MNRVLITGGAGFIGSNLTKKLLADDSCHVTCIDNFDPFYPRERKEKNIRHFLSKNNYTFIEGDIRNPDDLNEVRDVDVIVHLAAKAGVRDSIKDPFVYQNVNISGTLNLLEFAKHHAVKQFLFASSSSVYGTNQNLPWKEDEHLYPISPYAYTKLANEMLGHVYSHLYGIRFLALRFFTVYGPGQRPDLAICKFFDLILHNQPIPVFGNGASSRDYTFIEDIVKGIVAAIQYTGSGFEIFNLGSNSKISLMQLVSAIEEVCGKKANIELLAEQPGDVDQTCADIGKANRLLNYYPSTKLKEGLTAFYKWYLKS